MASYMQNLRRRSPPLHIRRRRHHGAISLPLGSKAAMQQASIGSLVIHEACSFFLLSSFFFLFFFFRSMSWAVLLLPKYIQ